MMYDSFHSDSAMRRLCWTVAAALLTTVTAQSQPQGPIVYWRDARAAVVRDTLYSQGGMIGANLTNGFVSSGPAGLSKFNFSTSFNQTSNFTYLFRAESLNITDPGITPHINGFMAANDLEWYAFGGLAWQKASNQTQGVIRDGLYQPNAAATNAPVGISPSWAPQGNKSTVFVTNGGGVNVPSENLSFYFSGLKSNASIEMSWRTSTGYLDIPNQLVKSMLKVDTKTFASSEWTEYPLPDDVVPRAEAVLAWVPTGTSGAVIVIGGLPFPTDLDQFTTCKISNASDPLKVTANAQAPNFMTTIPVYDVATGTWYTQTTNGSPPPRLVHACAVVATASDGKSHNIFVYGGFDGNNSTNVNDDVWVLSVPSFVWIKVATGTTSHGRFSHVCAKPYPDQMLVVGGVTACRDRLNGPFADVFNLNTLTWTGAYDPLKWDNYTVHPTISAAIQASPTATIQAGLLSLFQAKYAKSIQTWYPYTPEATIEPTTSPTPKQSSTPPVSPRPSWLIPVAVAVPVVGVIALIAALWFCCRRRHRDTDASDGTKSQKRVTSWLKQSAKSERSDDEMTQVDQRDTIYEVIGDSAHKSVAHTNVAELNNESIYNTAELVGNHTKIPRRPVGQSDQHPYELPAEPIGTVKSPVAKARPIGSSSVTSKEASATMPSSASPKSQSMSPYVLTHTRSDDSGVSAPPNDLILPQHVSNTGNSNVPARKMVARPTERDQVSPEPSPPLSPPAIPSMGPTVHSVSPPLTPPQQSTTNFQHMHNTSPLSPNLPDLSGTHQDSNFEHSREERRRSMVIEDLPDFLDADFDHGPGSKKGVREWPGTL